MRHKKKLSLILLSVFIPAAILALFLPVRYQISGTGKLYPIQEWTLVKDTEGGLISTVHHHQKGIITQLASYRFERGDIARFQLDTNRIGPYIQIRDTLGKISSFQLERKLNKLNYDLEVEKAKLIDIRTGQKAPVRQEARQRLIFAREQLKLAEINYQRQKELFDSGAIAEQILNEVENQYRLAQIQVSIAESSLAAAEIGEKPELIRVALAKIENIEQELAFLRTKQSGYHIVAPISGRFSESITPEQVFAMDDTSNWVIVIPVEVGQMQYVEPGSKITTGRDGLSAVVMDIPNRIEVLDGRQVVLIKAKSIGEQSHMRKGMLFSCKIEAGEIAAWKYLQRKMEF